MWSDFSKEICKHHVWLPVHCVIDWLIYREHDCPGAPDFFEVIREAIGYKTKTTIKIGICVLI